MQIDLEVSRELHKWINDFQSAPARTETTIRRAMTKLSPFAERSVLRTVSRSTTHLSQKNLKDLGRLRVTLYRPSQCSDEFELVIWVGLADIPAHSLGRPNQKWHQNREVPLGRYFCVSTGGYSQRDRVSASTKLET